MHFALLSVTLSKILLLVSLSRVPAYAMSMKTLLLLVKWSSTLHRPTTHLITLSLNHYVHTQLDSFV